MIEPLEQQKSREELRNQGLERAARRTNAQYKISLAQATSWHAAAGDAFGAYQTPIEYNQPAGAPAQRLSEGLSRTWSNMAVIGRVDCETIDTYSK
jgi:hypothetical protein